MTGEEKQKAINALKISVPIKALTQEKFTDYIQTLNKIMDWLEQETVSKESYDHEYFLRKEFEMKIARLEQELTAKNDLAVDCVSREKVYYMITNGKYSDEDYEQFIDRLVNELEKLPLVTPQTRKGYWIYDYTSADGHKVYHCSECGCYLKPKHSEPLNSFKWCSLCGAKMEAESEG